MNPENVREPSAAGPASGDAKAWWGRRRLRYNALLLAAGLIGGAAFAAVFELIPLREGDEITFLQGIAFLFFMGLANVGYSLGQLSERLLHPTDIQRYRRRMFALGTAVSVAVPLSVPILFAVERVFFRPIPVGPSCHEAVSAMDEFLQGNIRSDSPPAFVSCPGEDEETGVYSVAQRKWMGEEEAREACEPAGCNRWTQSSVRAQRQVCDTWRPPKGKFQFGFRACFRIIFKTVNGRWQIGDLIQTDIT